MQSMSGDDPLCTAVFKTGLAQVRFRAQDAFLHTRHYPQKLCLTANTWGVRNKHKIGLPPPPRAQWIHNSTTAQSNELNDASDEPLADFCAEDTSSEESARW